MADSVILVRVPAWIREYGSSGNPDNRGVADFVTCETYEAVRTLQAELIAISNGRCSEDMLNKIVGPGRKAKFGSYTEWAKSMLIWLASHKQA